MRAFGFAERRAPDGAVPPGVEWIRLEPVAHGSTWVARAARRDALAASLAEALAERPADVVAGQLHAGPAAVEAARATGAASVLFASGYESICHWAFGAGSACRPETSCRGCPRALALEPAEREAKWSERDAQDRALATATELVAPSRVMAAAVELACGRRPHVVAPVTRANAAARADRDGHVAAMASFWTVDKGVELLAPIAERIPDRRVVVQVPPAGLREDVAGALAALPNVTLRPPPGSINELLDGCALLIVPSQLAEPFGRVAFEGLSAGVPVLASDTGGLRETVPAGQRVVASGDPSAWSAAIVRHLEPDRWAAARIAGSRAADAVLATRPLERAERILVAGRLTPAGPGTTVRAPR